MSLSSIAEVYAAIDRLDGDTPAEKAFIAFRSGYTELVDDDIVPGSAVTVRFSNHREEREISASVRLDRPHRIRRHPARVTA